MNPESRFKVRLFKKIEKANIPNLYLKKLVAGSVAGLPDVLIIVNGTIIMPELKVPGNYPTALQWLNIERINAAGGYSFPLYPEEENDFVEWLKEISEA
jgi:hypothetical protein